MTEAYTFAFLNSTTCEYGGEEFLEGRYGVLLRLVLCQVFPRVRADCGEMFSPFGKPANPMPVDR
jgi:hypothetical protein